MLEDDNVEVISKNPNKGTIQGGGILEIKDSTSTDFIVKEIHRFCQTTEGLGDKDIVKEQENDYSVMKRLGNLPWFPVRLTLTMM